MRRAVPRTAALALAVVVAGPVPVAGARTGGAADAAPPPDVVTVQVVSVNGSGCPAGTAAVRPGADGTSFTVSYGDYTARTGPGAAPTDVRKNCQLGVLVSVPQGFTYAIARADYSGGAALAAGAIGTERATYYFQGSAESVASTRTFAGPVRARWYAVDAAEEAELVWAPCGAQRILNINTELRVDDAGSAPGAASALSMRWSAGSVSTVYHLSWARC